MRKQKRFTFAVVKTKDKYRIQCNETKEFVSGDMSSFKEAKKVFNECVKTEDFKLASTTMSLEDIKKRTDLFGGRLRPVKKTWTIEEARLVAKLYISRGELYHKNKKLYLAA